jgi:hypothetical protein
MRLTLRRAKWVDYFGVARDLGGTNWYQSRSGIWLAELAPKDGLNMLQARPQLVLLLGESQFGCDAHR